MKVKDLISLLQNADPNMTVCFFTEDSVLELDSVEVNVCSGAFRKIKENEIVYSLDKGEYIGIGFPEDLADIVENVNDLNDE